MYRSVLVYLCKMNEKLELCKDEAKAFSLQ